MSNDLKDALEELLKDVKELNAIFEGGEWLIEPMPTVDDYNENWQIHPDSELPINDLKSEPIDFEKAPF